MLNTQTKILLLVFAGLVLVYLLYNGKSSNEVKAPETFIDGQVDGSRLPQPVVAARPQDVESLAGSVDSAQLSQDDMIKHFSPEAAWLESKFDGRNRAPPGQFKKSSFVDGKRGNLGPSNWDAYFDQNNNVIGGSQALSNENFLPVDETNGEYAVFKQKGRATCGSNQNCDPEELFDVDKYLPQEINSDFFETMPEPVSIKNRHLINITKPLGVNTIGTSKRNMSYDLRTEPANPKYVVSPFLNSSIEPGLSRNPIF